MIKILLSSKLGEYRVKQSELSRLTGIRPNTVNDLYHEIAERVNLEQLDLLCEFFECEVSDLLKREPNKEPRLEYTITDILEKRDQDE